MQGLEEEPQQASARPRRYTREDFLALKDQASEIEDIAISIPKEIDVNGKGLTTEKGKELKGMSGENWNKDLMPQGIGGDKGKRGKRDYPGAIYKYTKEEMLAISKAGGKSQGARPEDLPANLCRTEPGNISEDAKRDREMRNNRGDRGDNRKVDSGRDFRSAREGIPAPRERDEKQSSRDRNIDRTILGRKLSNNDEKKRYTPSHH